MQMRDQMDTLPCHIPHNQYITFIFSQPPNASSSFLKTMLRRCLWEYKTKVESQTKRTYKTQWHKITLKITKSLLSRDVELDMAGGFLESLPLNMFTSKSLFSSPEAINILSNDAMRNYLQTQGKARAVNSGMLFTRKLHKGEKLYVCIFSLTPENENQIKYSL